MTVLLLLAALAGPPAPVVAQSVPVEQIADDSADHCFAAIGIGAADLLSTGWALSRCPRCRESNPLGVNADARIALKVGGSALVCWGAYRLERAGHHKTARNATILFAVGTAIMVGNNTVHAIRRR